MGNLEPIRGHYLSFAECLLWGHSRLFDRVPTTSALPYKTDIVIERRHVSKVPIAVGDPQVTFKANCGARIGRPSDKPTADGERHHLSSPRMTKMKTVLILIHMLYSHECCEDHHCRPVPCNEVIDLGDDGWRWRDRTFPRWTLRASPDGNCHVCVANIPVCIYLPPRV